MTNKQIEAIKLSPIRSLWNTVINWIGFRIHFPKDFNGQVFKMKDGIEFEIFRHVIVGSKTLSHYEKGAIFLVKFKLSKMSVEKNIKFSRIPIPMFIGLPGFRAKFWFLDRKTGYNQGIYQWKTENNAKNYSKSFAINFMTKRSKPNSVSYEIIPNENIYQFLEKMNKNAV